MIHAIYQTPDRSFPDVSPEHEAAEAFIGTHTGPLPIDGDTFDRYGRTWRIVVVAAIHGDPKWTFRARAVVVPAETATPVPLTLP